jgi:hypothetical protein
MELLYFFFVFAFIGVFVCLVLGLIGTFFGWCQEFSEWMGRRGWRYSTRELFIAITVAAIVFGLIGILVRWGKAA